jgi:hypothetical protein
MNTTRDFEIAGSCDREVRWTQTARAVTDGIYHSVGDVVLLENSLKEGVKIRIFMNVDSSVDWFGLAFFRLFSPTAGRGRSGVNVTETAIPFPLLYALSAVVHEATPLRRMIIVPSPITSESWSLAGYWKVSLGPS